MPKGRRGGNQELRIIGGRWRGRKLRFPIVEGLRPTPDRVRETVFNWLAEPIVDARCLDLFAGSGALGLEALSRGAKQVVLVENSAAACKALREHVQTLATNDAQIMQNDVLSYMRQKNHGEPFDIVFMDPPYGHGLLAQGLALLVSNHWLHTGTLVYLEAESTLPALPLDENWELKRSKTAGQVGYHLAIFLGLPQIAEQP